MSMRPLYEIWNWHKAMSETSEDACDRISHRNMARDIDSYITAHAQMVEKVRDVAEWMAQNACAEVPGMAEQADKLRAMKPEHGTRFRITRVIATVVIDRTPRVVEE